jgi:hypothetical protein
VRIIRSGSGISGLSRKSRNCSSVIPLFSPPFAGSLPEFSDKNSFSDSHLYSTPLSKEYLTENTEKTQKVHEKHIIHEKHAFA